MPEFHLTVMGHRFYESTMPSLVRAVEALNKKLDSLVEGAHLNQIEDERAAAAFAMREAIAHTVLEQLRHVNLTSVEQLAEIIRSVPLPEHAPESPGAEQEGR